MKMLAGITASGRKRMLKNLDERSSSNVSLCLSFHSSHK